MEWLKELEGKVARVGKEIAELRKQNRSLSSQVKRLKREAQSAGEAGSAEWEKERSEIRQRAEAVASTLESMLD